MKTWGWCMVSGRSVCARCVGSINARYFRFAILFPASYVFAELLRLVSLS